jgi:hypothetical protein
MGMLVVLAVVGFVAVVIGLFVHAIDSEGKSRHGWLIVVPLLIFAGWLLEMLIMRP